MAGLTREPDVESAYGRTATGWLTFRRPRSGVGDQRRQKKIEDREKMDGTADGEAMKELGDGPHSTEIGGDRVARREALCVMRCGICPNAAVHPGALRRVCP